MTNEEKTQNENESFKTRICQRKTQGSTKCLNITVTVLNENQSKLKRRTVNIFESERFKTRICLRKIKGSTKCLNPALMCSTKTYRS